MKHIYEKGNIALSALILVMSIGMITIVAYGSSILLYTQYTVATIRSREAFILADNCMEEVLLKIQRIPNYTTSSITIPPGTCAVSIVANGAQRTVTVDGAIESYHKKLEAVVTVYYYSISLDSWREID